MKLKTILKNKRAQEEIVGFAIIIVIVAVILLIFLGFSLRQKPEKEMVESSEVENFLTATMQYTTDCRNDVDSEYFSVQDLIFSCDDGDQCLDNRDSCDVLLTTLEGITKESWTLGEDGNAKGYIFNISLQGEEVFAVSRGNSSVNYKGHLSSLARRYNALFTVYY